MTIHPESSLPLRKGQKSAPAPASPVEDKDSLRSKAVARVIDAVAEGVCVGLADGPRSIYFNGTPLVNADGSVNFPGVTWDQRIGLPQQDPMPGFPEIESEISVEAEVFAGRPVTRRMENTLATAVRVTVTVPAIFDQNTTSGNTTGSRIDFVLRIRRAAAGAAWQEFQLAIVGKQTGPYQEAYRIGLPQPGPWDIQIDRITPDSTRATLQNGLVFSSYTEIIEHQLTYQDTAYIGLSFDAELFGNQVPQRSYDYKGWICRVPSNYDPESRFYAGIWNGSFKAAWTDNPAWLLLQLMTHPRGAGLSDAQVDVFGLYRLAQYCDEFVDDGFGGREPRFTANFVLNTREEAYAVINALASTMRAMVYWATGAVQVVGDMPTDPSVLVSKSNTIGGFEYSGSGLKARHTACAVSFLDRADNYERAIEVYEDPVGIEKYGYNISEVAAFACTSRGQAQRVARWLVITEAIEGDALTYRASVDHINVVPGAVVSVADSDYAGVRAGGRIRSATTAQVEIDAPVTLQTGQSYRLKVVLPDLTVHERPVILTPGATTVLRLASPLHAAPQPEAQWVLLSSALEPRQFRVISVAEQNDLEYQVVTVSHDPTKFARIEQGLILDTPPFSTLPDPGVIGAPGAITVDRRYLSTPGGWTVALDLSWEPSPSPYVRGYEVRYRRNNGNWIILPQTSARNFTITGETASGHFEFHVLAVNFVGKMSSPSILVIDILDTSPITLIRPSGLELEGQGNNTVFTGRSPKFAWRATALRGAYPLGQEPAAGAGYLDEIFRDYEVRVYDLGNRLIFVDHTTFNWYTFEFEKNAATLNGPHRAFKFVVLMRDKWGNVSLPAELEVVNPAPPQVTNLSVQAGVEVVFVKFDRPADADFSGCLIWIGGATGYVPSDSTLVYDGPDTFVSIPREANTSAYVRVAAYDAFGKTGLNISPEILVTVGGFAGTDFIPPRAPTGLILSSRSEIQADGSYLYWLKATWDENVEDDFLIYGLAISENDEDGFVFYTTHQPTYEWVVQGGSTYRVKLTATDSSANTSVYSAEAVHTVTGQGAPPADPATLEILPSLRTLWLTWSQHPAADFSHMEIWVNTANDRSTATLLGNGGGTTFAHQGLDSGNTSAGGAAPVGSVRYYWIRAVNRSGIRSGFFPASATGGRRGETLKLDEKDFPPLVVKDAFIDQINAAKITAGSVLSASVTVNGRALGAIVDGVGDPALAINQGTTQIDPGKILISGGTTLSSWRSGSDVTKIDGGNIAANTITTNKLSVGSRNVQFLGTEFMAHKDTLTGQQPNTVTWTAGIAVMVNDGGNGHLPEQIAAGSARWTGDIMYLYWERGTGQIRATTDPNLPYQNPNRLLLGYYYGAARLMMTMGLTIIDGDTIRTGSINANRIQAQSITANQLSTGLLITNEAQIGNGLITNATISNAFVADAYVKNLTADKIKGGTIDATYIQVGGNIPGRAPRAGSVGIYSFNGHRSIRYFDINDTERVVLGQLGEQVNVAQDGFYVRNEQGQMVFSVNGLGVNIVGTDSIQGNAVSASLYSEAFRTVYTSVAGGMIHLLYTYGAGVGGFFTGENNQTIATYGTLPFALARLRVQGLGAASGGVAVWDVGLAGAGFLERTISRKVQFAKGQSFEVVIEAFNGNTGTWFEINNSLTTMTGTLMLVEYKR